MKRILTNMLVAGALIGLAASPVVARVSDKDVEDDAKTPADVVSWGLGTKLQRFSQSTKITTKNVKDLVPAWCFCLGKEMQRGQQ